MTKRSFIITLSMGIIVIFLFTDCAFAGVSKLMHTTSAPSATPPEGKSMIVFLRDGGKFGGYLIKAFNHFTTLWDGTNFIGDIDFNQSCAYICDPGKHYFINKSLERVGVVEAELLPGKIYGLQFIEPNNTALAGSAQLEPIKGGPNLERIFNARIKQDNWVTPSPAATSYAFEKQADIALIIKDFVYGEKNDRIRHLAREEHIWVFPDDLKEVSEALSSSDRGKVVQTLKALRRTDVPQAVPHVLPLLNDKDPGLIRDACRTLAVIADKTAIPSIEPLLKDKRKDVRKDAQDAIDKLNAK